jgi:hypothetical protein
LLFVSAVTDAGMGLTTESSLSPKSFVALSYTASIERLTKRGTRWQNPGSELDTRGWRAYGFAKIKLKAEIPGTILSVLEIKKKISDKVFARAKSASLADPSRGRQGHR